MIQNRINDCGYQRSQIFQCHFYCCEKEAQRQFKVIYYIYKIKDFKNVLKNKKINLFCFTFAPQWIQSRPIGFYTLKM